MIRLPMRLPLRALVGLIAVMPHISHAQPAGEPAPVFRFAPTENRLRAML